MDGAPRYLPNVAKALEVALWIASDQPKIDIYHLVKASYFADKRHLAEHGRPIMGDAYQAAWFGPLPQVIYNLVRHEPMELLALGNHGPLPIRLDDDKCVVAERSANLSALSESDVAALRHGVDHVKARSFKDLYWETHADPAYRNAKGGLIDYRDFLDEADPDREAKAAYIAEAAPHAVF